MSEEKTQIELKKESYPKINFGLIGPSGSGKFCLMGRIYYNDFIPHHYHGPGQSWTFVKVDVNNEKFEIKFLTETAKDHFKRLMLDDFVNECEHGILVYDITQEMNYNFDYLKKMIDEINEMKEKRRKKKPTYFMLGTKLDREKERKTKAEDAEKFCQVNKCIFIGETTLKIWIKKF